MTAETAISLLAGAGSFIGAVIVAAIAAGRLRERTDRVEKDVETNTGKIDALVKETAEMRRDAHALRNTTQQFEIRHAGEMADLKKVLDRLTEGQQAIAVTVAEISATLKNRTE